MQVAEREELRQSLGDSVAYEKQVKYLESVIDSKESIERICWRENFHELPPGGNHERRDMHQFQPWNLRIRRSG